MNPSDPMAHEDDAPVTIATFGNPHEAELARVALASAGVPSFVGTDHGQYLTSAAWVQLQVARHDRQLASSVLEGGPPGATGEPAAQEDLRGARLQRRFRIARWFLYATTVPLVLAALVFPAPLFLVPLGLALWSKSDPRLAFGTATVLQGVVSFGLIATFGLGGLTSVIPLIAYNFAWLGAGSRPPAQLLESPLPKTPVVEVGDEWKTDAASREPAEQPMWWIRPIRYLLLGAIGVWALWAMVK